MIGPARNQAASRRASTWCGPRGRRHRLDCAYCFYLQKKVVFAPPKRTCGCPVRIPRLPHRQLCPAASPRRRWSSSGGAGSRPCWASSTTRRVVEIQQRFVKRKRITNSLRANGTLLTDRWCTFLRKHGFTVGLGSLDGPREIHDRLAAGTGRARHLRRGDAGLGLLKQHGVAYNVLACVARETARQPRRSTASCGTRAWSSSSSPRWWSVGRRRDRRAGAPAGEFASPGAADGPAAVTPLVRPAGGGDFLIATRVRGVGPPRCGRRLRDELRVGAERWIGNPSPVCVHATQCGRAGGGAQRRRLRL